MYYRSLKTAKADYSILYVRLLVNNVYQQNHTIDNNYHHQEIDNIRQDIERREFER